METRIELNVSQNKLLELIALFSSYEQDIGGLSAKELRRQTGLTEDMLNTLLSQLCERGLVLCKQGRRKYRDGRNGIVPVYLISEAANAYLPSNNGDDHD